MLSIVASLYQSAPYLDAFISRMTQAAEQVSKDFEIVLVNDGSPDDSLARSKAHADSNPRVRVVDLSRNFGHHRAMMVGLEHARGNHVFLIDADLEEPPELLTSFWERMHASEGLDVVFGQSERRRGNWIDRCFGSLYYSLVRTVGGVPVTHNLATVRLMTRRYVDSLLEFRERETFMAGLWHATGYRQESMLFEKGHKGKTSYNLALKLAMVVNSITAFSARPLLFIFYTGLGMSLVGATLAGWLVARRLFQDIPIIGWTSVMVSIWFLGGLIILFLGIIGIYLAKVFSEVKQRPYATIREVYRGESNVSSS